MEVKTIYAQHDKQYLKELLTKDYSGLIPNNVILNKTIPGLGATSCEIESKRNSIIIEPNVPVIDGKVGKYPNGRWDYQILGVRKKISLHAIKSYILRKDIPYKKILTTPESFKRVREAFEAENMLGELYSYFFLIDESEKFIQDMDFRSSLFEIMKEFWLFPNRAMVSATPLIPSDKAFQEENFIYLKIEPKYEYRKPLILNKTNSVLSCVEEVFKEMPVSKICFFINSIDLITNIIEHLGIKDNSRIFCSEDAFGKLQDKGYTDYTAFINQNEEGYSDLIKNNFFTSRFFSAVDIDLDEDIDVASIIVTDNYSAPFSKVDPETQVMQILGRFRNGKGTWVNHHITNFREDIPVRSKQFILDYNKGLLAGFIAVHTLFKNQENPVTKKALQSVWESMKFHGYLYLYNNKLRINHYLIDNEIEDEKVKGFYINSGVLSYAYRSFPSFYLLIEREFWYANEDKVNFKRDNLGLPDLRREMVRVYDEIMNDELEGPLSNHFNDYEIKKEGGFIIGAHHYLEADNLELLNYNEKVIDQVLSVLFDAHEVGNPYFYKTIYKEFVMGKAYSVKYITVKLDKIFKMFSIDKTTKATGLAEYCTLSTRVNINKDGYKLKGEVRPKGYIVLGHLMSDKAF